MSEVPWLKLVYDSSVDVPKLAPKPHQLSLPFEQTDTILIFNTNKVKSQTFLFALGSIRPHWVFDLRYNPRLDVLAGSRSQAFRYFDDLNAHYVDVFGLIDVKDRRRELARKRKFVTILRRYLNEEVENSGPYLALLDDDGIMEVVTDSAQDVISTLTGRPTSLSQLAISNEC